MINSAITYSAIIANVGYMKNLVSGARENVYLGLKRRDGINYYGLFATRESFTPQGSTTAEPKQFVFLMPDYIEQLLKTGELVLMGGVKDLLNMGWDTDFVTQYAGVKSEYFTNGATILAGTNKYALADIGTMPAFATRLGADITKEQVEALLNITNDILPTEPQTLVFGGTTGGVALANLSLDKAASPIDAVKAFAGNPVDYVKENPISGVVLGVVAWDVIANVTGAVRPVLVGKKPYLGLINTAKGRGRGRRK